MALPGEEEISGKIRLRHEGEEEARACAAYCGVLVAGRARSGHAGRSWPDRRGRGGESEKAIARRIRRSIHMVDTSVKQIDQQFEVSSRGESMAHLLMTPCDDWLRNT